MRCKPHLFVIAVAGSTALAGGAWAQPLDLSLTADAKAIAAAPLSLAGAPRRPAPDLANPLDPLAPTTLQSTTLETAVFARTAVDHHFAGRDQVTGSIGFLCGLQPGHADNGAAGAYGVDPHGRFVGAKFSIAFK